MFSIKLTSKRVSVPKIASGINIIHDNFARQLNVETIGVMKILAPVRSGQLRNSIHTIIMRVTRKGQIDRRANIVVGPTADHAKYVVRGTTLTKGRYVPEIDRRVTTGEHPGIRPNNFIVETAVIMEKKAQELGERLYRQWEKSWRVVR